MKFNVISGMPRSGSTLLCNILSQNPNFHVSSTSSIPTLLQNIRTYFSASLEVRHLLQIEKDSTFLRIRNVLLGIIYNWYHDYTDKVVFDKSRAWNNNNLLLNSIDPNAKQIVCVRDVREIFSSIEKQYRKTAIVSNITENISDRARMQFSKEGVIGSCLDGVENLLRNKFENVYILSYDKLVANPEKVIKEIYNFLGEEYFKHDFENIRNATNEADGHYLWKFPHEGSGKVQKQETSDWKKYIPNDVENKILEMTKEYNILIQPYI